MTKFQVQANGTVFGVYEADDQQQARDLCAQDAGYDSEADMVEQLGRPSELVAIAGEEWEAWEDGGEEVAFFLADGDNPVEEGARALGVDVSEALNVKRA